VAAGGIARVCRKRLRGQFVLRRAEAENGGKAEQIISHDEITRFAGMSQAIDIIAAQKSTLFAGSFVFNGLTPF
jgi:hypothetical protein